MKKFLKEYWLQLALLVFFGTLVSLTIGLLYWFSPNSNRPTSYHQSFHDIYCVEGTAYLVMGYAVVIAPPQSKHHTACAALPPKESTK
jgi:hypothetical protein